MQWTVGVGLICGGFFAMVLGLVLAFMGFSLGWSPAGAVGHAMPFFVYGGFAGGIAGAVVCWHDLRKSAF